MSAAIRMILTLTLLLGISGALSAQETATTETTSTTTTATTTTAEAGDEVTATDTTATTATTTTASAEEVEYSVERTRGEFREVLNRYSNQMSTLLALEPSLLSNEEFLQGHPDLAAFIAKHPEVAQHPNQFVDSPQSVRAQSGFGEILENLMIFGIFVFIAAVLAWLVRTIIEQKRWSRLSSQQAEVHNKILDRFGNTEELMQYIKSPAGTKFLESAPIPLHTEPVAAAITAKGAPVARVLRSIQIGIIVAAAGFGMLLVSFRFDRGTAADLFAMGTIGLCIGGGFIASALVSLFMSRKLGVWQGPGDDAEIVK